MRKSLKNSILLLLVCLLLSLCGCRSNAAPEATPTPSIEATPTPEPTPVPLNEALPLQLAAELTDGDHSTWAVTFEGSGVILESTERKIGSVYLEWESIPGQWKLTADGQTILCGQNGYLHEYVELDAPANYIVIETPVPLCDVYAFEPGSEIPDWVQIWHPALEKADLLLMPTHADDEHIFFGGMMPYYAGEKGYKVQVVYLTSHHWNNPVRSHELLDGLWTAGIRNYPVIGNFNDRYADSLEVALERFDKTEILKFQVEMLRRFQPSVVIGHDLNGEYGHGVHILNAISLTEAVTLAADATVFTDSANKYGVWDTPKLYLHLYPENEIIMDWSVPLTAFGGTTALDVARAGFACHESQQGYFYVYGEGDAYDSRRFGLYRSTVGPDVQGGDVFENITSFY